MKDIASSSCSLSSSSSRGVGGVLSARLEWSLSRRERYYWVKGGGRCATFAMNTSYSALKPCATERVPFLAISQAINCLATIIWSLRDKDKDRCEAHTQNVPATPFEDDDEYEDEIRGLVTIRIGNQL